MPSKVIDLSHPIEPGMTLYPGTEDTSFVLCATYAEQGWEERRVCLSSHAGTHVDAPAHMLPGAPRLDAFGPDRFLGRGCVLDASAGLGLEALQAKEELLRRSDFLLFRTGWGRYWGQERFLQDFPAITGEAAQWLATLGLKGYGADTISVDLIDSHDLPVHHALMRAGMLLVESLARLEELPEEGFSLCVAPLPLKGGEGAPARVLAWLD